MVDPPRLRTGGPVQISEEELRDVRGIGIWASWPINNRWARIDQVHLSAREFERE